MIIFIYTLFFRKESRLNFFKSHSSQPSQSEKRKKRDFCEYEIRRRVPLMAKMVIF